ncbi:hypothetical protein ACFO3D_05900 [Virgibacillus kekensis]|uniref:Uncharacterized protein n=1 Tax=Virgibacillus kekensis TaxID=202261 RepID=A0ABV9DG15_9BACI
MPIIDAYFRTENDAESAKASLETLKVENSSVEPVTEELRNKLIEILRDMFTTPDEDPHHPYLLHAEVKQEDFQEAVDVVKKGKGFITIDTE